MNLRQEKKMAIIDILCRNLLVLYLGAFIRYVVNRMLKSKKSFHTILYGVTEKSKEDEISNINNEFVNRIYGIVGLIIIVIIIVLIIR